MCRITVRKGPEYDPTLDASGQTASIQRLLQCNCIGRITKYAQLNAITV